MRRGLSIGKQVFRPPKQVRDGVAHISKMGCNALQVEENGYRRHTEWRQRQVVRRSSYSLVSLETRISSQEDVSYTWQENYIKVNFWLNGRHTTVLNGLGQHDHDRPEIYITAGPPEMLKVDILNPQAQVAVVALCLLPEFFSDHMGLGPDELPEPLRSIVLPGERPYAFHRMRFTPDLMAASRAILAAPLSVRRSPLYAGAKVTELMCLLLSRMSAADGESELRYDESHQQRRLLQARDLVTHYYRNPPSLNQICKEVGLNRMALTLGFKQKFGVPIYEYVRRLRMERARELLQEEGHTIASVSAAVGYDHACNFSTAFRAYFGCSPKILRRSKMNPKLYPFTE